MSFIYVSPDHDLDARTLAALRACLSSVYGLPTRRLIAPEPPAEVFDSRRRQYSSTGILQHMATTPPPNAARVLAVTDKDLFIPMLTFIYGQAQLGGEVAVVSLARLRQEFYGLPPDPELLLERTLKEALHEMGHSFGLTHCSDSECAMSLSTNIQQVDAKRVAYCAPCDQLVQERIAEQLSNNGGRPTLEADA